MFRGCDLDALNRQPYSDELAGALGDLLEAQGFPGIKSILDHLQCLYHLEMLQLQPELYWMGSTPEEKASNHANELAATRSLLYLELARMGEDMDSPHPWEASPN